MDPRHFRGGPQGPRIVITALSLLIATSCTPPADPASDEPADPQVAIGGQHLSGQAASKLTLFESGQVRPLAISPDKQLLFAVNTPDNRLEIFRIGPSQLVRTTPSRRASSPAAGSSTRTRAPARAHALHGHACSPARAARCALRCGARCARQDREAGACTPSRSGLRLLYSSNYFLFHQ
jgi:hypothetical protein